MVLCDSYFTRFVTSVTKDLLFDTFFIAVFPTIQDFDYHLIQHFESHLPRNGLYDGWEANQRLYQT